MKKWQEQFLKEIGVPATEENLGAFDESTLYKFRELKMALIELWENIKYEVRKLCQR